MSEPECRMFRLLTCQIEYTPQNIQTYYNATGKARQYLVVLYHLCSFMHPVIQKYLLGALMFQTLIHL